MGAKLRRMRLTPEMVASVHRPMPPAGPPVGVAASVDSDHELAVREALRGAPASGEVWIFAYGSLIWKPACDILERRVGTIRGWHRSFCLGWDRRYRGNPEQPGLMMALDRGGQCKGVVQRLPPDAVEENLGKLFRREMPLTPSPFPPRWINVATDGGPVRAIAFIVDRNGRAYIGGLSTEETADALAVAVGPWGSMAEYLHSTISHLDALGIHDSYLWHMQELVADRIEAAAAARAT